MCKKLRELWGKFQKWVSEHPDDILLTGCVLVISGIVISFVNLSLCANLVILTGTLFLGLGFYLKGKNNSETKLSDYGHFMLGLGALIALPQTPELLSKITEIRDGVSSLKISEEKARSILIELWHNTIQPTVEPIVQAAENKHAKKEIIEKIRDLIRKPKSCEDKKILIEHFNPPTPSERSSAPIVYLTPDSADEIIQYLDKEGFTKDNVESLLQEHLKVWRPQYDSMRCDR